jgi:hypothetical protein
MRYIGYLLTNHRLGFGDYRNAIQEHADGCARETTLLGLRFTAVDMDRTFRRSFAHSLIRFSLLTLHKAAQSADDAEKDKIAAESWEEGIYDGVQEAINRMESGFSKIQQKQAEAGKKVSDDIDASTQRLKTGIDDSTELLGGRLDHSITLLSRSADKITSLTAPITTLKTGFT